MSDEKQPNEITTPQGKASWFLPPSGYAMFYVTGDGDRVQIPTDVMAQAAKIARLEAALREIRDIAMYRNDGTDIINLCDSALEGGDE